MNTEGLVEKVETQAVPVLARYIITVYVLTNTIFRRLTSSGICSLFMLHK